ncbi:MAG: SGNH/GDSL hydrolase family protein [Balneolaceae bacterium]|nr:SGNH/GDSL hydrolase family protein [Balneolaceae bacterium]MBO6547106.1 SGNH/GDSL hydrolase family protein [Balneolaceae bacterium]MBO6647947.1 SGNH/GDSL hydrolase family protein [Balneolaceae bacterium]
MLFLSVCASSPERNSVDEVNQNISESISFLALGDSYTIGESVPADKRWPVQLADSLKIEGIEVTDLKIIATTGWTTAELQQGISEAELNPPYNLVSLLIGVNNQYRGYDIEIYRAEFRELLEQAIMFAGGDSSNVFVVSIPNYGVTPFGQTRGEVRIRKELLEYDSIAKEIASEYNIPFVNITPISENAKIDMSLIADDELHPSGKMYSHWVSEMLPVVLSRIEQ